MVASRSLQAQLRRDRVCLWKHGLASVWWDRGRGVGGGPMCKRSLAILGVLSCLVLVWADALTASSAIPLTLGEMTRESASIVAGTVIDATSRASGNGALTDVVVRIDEPILTAPLATSMITLTFWGGRIGRRRM